MPLMPKIMQKTSLPEQIMELIASQITSGQLQPGEKLPGERKLAEMFGVTRNGVREALRALSLLGLITIKPGGGNFVSEKNMSLPKDTITWMYHRELHNFNDIYAARKLIETEIYLSFFRNRTEETVQEYERKVNALPALCTPRDTAAAFVDALADIDLYVGSHCGNEIYTRLMQMIVTLREEYALKSSELLEARHQSVKDRMKVLHAVRSEDENKVRRSLGTFFRNALFTTQE